MTFEPDLVRELLRRLYPPAAEQPELLLDTFVLSPPHLPGYAPAVIREHWDRMRELGLIYISHDIEMRYHPDPVTVRASRAAERWGRAARDDAQWTGELAELRAMFDTLGPWPD